MLTLCDDTHRLNAILKQAWGDQRGPCGHHVVDPCFRPCCRSQTKSCVMQSTSL